MKEKEKEAEEAKKLAEAKVKEAEEEKEKFAKEGEQVDVNKHNQVLRKARELEAEKRELEEETERLKGVIKKEPKLPVKKEEEEQEEEEDDDDFWGEDGEKKKTPKDTSKDTDKIKALINEQIRPFVEAESTRNKVAKKQARQEFYIKYPQYLSDADKWAELLDELSNSIVPSGDYYQDLEKAHRLTSGEDFNQAQIEQKKKEIASNTGGSGTPNQKTKEGNNNYKLTDIDKKIVESTGVDADTVKQMRDLQSKGLISLEF